MIQSLSVEQALGLVYDAVILLWTPYLAPLTSFFTHLSPFGNTAFHNPLTQHTGEVSLTERQLLYLLG